MRKYAIYKGDDFLFEGTIYQCAKYLGVKMGSAYFYSMPTYHKRNKNGVKLFKIEED